MNFTAVKNQRKGFVLRYIRVDFAAVEGCKVLNGKEVCSLRRQFTVPRFNFGQQVRSHLRFQLSNYHYTPKRHEKLLLVQQALPRFCFFIIFIFNYRQKLKNYLTRTDLVPTVRVTLVHQKVDSGNEIGLGPVSQSAWQVQKGEGRRRKARREGLHRLPLSENPSARLEGVP